MVSIYKNVETGYDSLNYPHEIRKKRGKENKEKTDYIHSTLCTYSTQCSPIFIRSYYGKIK